MARNEVFREGQRQRAARRDHRRDTPPGPTDGETPGWETTPSKQMAARELFQEVQRRLLELREQGRDWAAVTAELGESSEALRKKLTRALARVMRELGVDEAGNG